MLVRSPSSWAVAVRAPDGTIHVESHATEERWPRLRRTLLRGPAAVVESISIGMRGIRIAVRVGSGSDVGADAMRAVFVPVAVGAVGLFVVLPGIVAAAYDGLVADVVEAAARAAVLLLYLVAVSRAEQSRRLFGYHGAEHMTIAAFERHARMPTADETAACSPVHVRCGTDFIALLVIACGVVFAFVPRRPVFAGGALRVLLVPVVAALAYELMRACARRPERAWARLVTWPGRALQRVTTRPPDAGQLEVAMAALRAALTSTSGPPEATDP